MTLRSADVYRVVTEAGYEIKATEWHDFYTTRGKIKLKDLKPGDELLIQSGKGQFGGEWLARSWACCSGLLTGDGHFTNRGKGEQAAVINLWGLDRDYAETVVSYHQCTDRGLCRERTRDYQVSAVAVPERNLIMIRSVIAGARARALRGFARRRKLQVPEIVWRGSEACVKAYLRALFQSRWDGEHRVRSSNAVARCDSHRASPSLLKDVQMLLANFGIFARIYKRREAASGLLPDGKGGNREYTPARPTMS